MPTTEEMLEAIDAQGKIDAASKKQDTANMIAEIDMRSTDQSAMGTALGYQQALLDGLTLGHGDELNAAFRTAVDVPIEFVSKGEVSNVFDTFQGHKRRLEGIQADTRDEHPYSTSAVETAGSVIPTISSAGAAVAPVAYNAGKGYVAKIVNGLADWAGTIGRGAVYGAAAGHGYSNASGEELLPDIVDSAKIGAAFTAAAHPAAKGVGMLTNQYSKWKGAPLMTPEMRAVGEVKSALEVGEKTVPQVAARMGKLGDDAMLADAGGPQVMALADELAQSSPLARNVAQNRLNTRQMGQGGRTLEQSNKALGGEPSYYNSLNEMVAHKKEVSRPLYERAYKQEVEFTPELEAILKTPAGKAAIAKAKILAANEGIPFRWFGETEGGKLNSLMTISEKQRVAPNMQSLDTVKRAMDDNIYDAHATEWGTIKPTDAARAEEKVVRRLRDELDRMNPDYRLARETYGGLTQAQRAMSTGKRFLTEWSEVTEEQLKNMSKSERTAFRTGMQQGLKEKVDTARDGADVTKRLFGSKEARNKLRITFPDDRSFREFTSTMLGEAEKFRTGKILGGSPTIKRSNDRDALNPGDIAVDSVTMGAAATAFRAANQWLKSKISSSRSPEQAKALSAILYETDPVKKKLMLDQLMRPEPIMPMQSLGSRFAEQGVQATGLLGAQREVKDQPFSRHRPYPSLLD